MISSLHDSSETFYNVAPNYLHLLFDVSKYPFLQVIHESCEIFGASQFFSVRSVHEDADAK